MLGSMAPIGKAAPETETKTSGTHWWLPVAAAVYLVSIAAAGRRSGAMRSSTLRMLWLCGRALRPRGSFGNLGTCCGDP